VRAIDESDELVNTLDQMLKKFYLDDNQSENQSKISLNDDQLEEKIIQLRRSGRERRASKLAEEMIQYDLRKKMPRADVIIRDKFSYKKILKCLIHMIRMLVTLTTDQQSDESQTLRDVMQRSD
jgi:CRISPR/Cas system CSM-associated protein Csm2 small subunit